MSTLQYKRKLSIVVSQANGAGIEFADFKCEFYVLRGDSQTPNSADVRIYNLSEHTANLLREKEYTTLTIQAGYAGNFGLIFTGTIKQTRKGRIDAKDTYVDITAADGDALYNFSMVALSFAAGTQAEDTLKGIIKGMVKSALGVDVGDSDLSQYLGYTPHFSASGQVRGQTIYGQGKDLLRRFAFDNNCIWSIQNGQVVMIPNNSYIPGEVPVISPTTGLIGVPEQTEGGIQFRCLLNPQIKIGSCVNLNSSVNLARVPLDSGLSSRTSAVEGAQADVAQRKLNSDGLYYVMQADCFGDSRGTPWYTDCTCLAVDASIPSNKAPFAAIDPSSGSIMRR